MQSLSVTHSASFVSTSTSTIRLPWTQVICVLFMPARPLFPFEDEITCRTCDITSCHRRIDALRLSAVAAASTWASVCKTSFSPSPHECLIPISADTSDATALMRAAAASLDHDSVSTASHRGAFGVTVILFFRGEGKLSSEDTLAQHRRRVWRQQFFPLPLLFAWSG